MHPNVHLKLGGRAAEVVDEPQVTSLAPGGHTDSPGGADGPHTASPIDLRHFYPHAQ